MLTAWRKISRPFIFRWPDSSGRPTAPSTYSSGPSEPWACRWVDRMPRSGRLLRLEEHRAGAVAEQHGGAAVRPIQDAGIHLRPDHQHAAHLAAADHRVRDPEAVDEAAARGRHVEAEAAGTDLCLHRHRRRRECLVRRAGAEDDGVHVGGARPGMGQGGLGRAGAHEGRRLVRPGDMALPDAGPLRDPGVRGVQPLRQFGVGHHPLRQVGSCPGQDRAHRHVSARPRARGWHPSAGWRSAPALRGCGR